MTAPRSKGLQVADEVVDAVRAINTALTTTAALDERQAMVRAVATRVGYQLPVDATDPDLIQRDIAANMRRSVEACLEVGRGLTVLKAACEHGSFMSRIDALGIEPRIAQRFIQAAAKFSNASLTTHLKAIGNQTRLFELLVLSDEQVDELLLTGQTGELALDEVASMSMKELRAAVREAKAERTAHEELLAAKGKQIDALKLKARRIQAAPPDEALAELKKEATGIANDAQGLVMGALRQAVMAIAAHGEDGAQTHRAFLAGLLAPLQLELTMLRQEFDLVDVSTDAAKTPWVLASEQEDAADAAAATQAANKPVRG